MQPQEGAGNDQEQQQYALIQQQRKKRMLIIVILVFSFYMVSNRAAQQQSRSGYPITTKSTAELMTNEEIANQILDSRRSTMDGYQDIKGAFYQRYKDEASNTSNTTPDLYGNPSQALLFSSLYTLKRKIFDGTWSVFETPRVVAIPTDTNNKSSTISKKESNSGIDDEIKTISEIEEFKTKGVFAFFDNSAGELSFQIDIKSFTEIRFYFQIKDDEFIDHKLLAGYIDVDCQQNFTIIDLDLVRFNATLPFIFNRYDHLSKSPTLLQNLNLEKYTVGWSPKLNLQIKSTDGPSDFQANFEVDLSELNIETNNKKTEYTVFITMIVIVQFGSILHLMRSFFTRENEEQKFSLISLSFAFVWDGFICFMHLFYSLDYDNSFHYFIFLYIILWSIFERGLITIIWKNRYQNQVGQTNIDRKRLCLFVALYGSLFALFFVIQKVFMQSWFICLINLYLVPQIVRNARRGHQVSVSKSFVFGFLGVRSLLILYFRGYSGNIGQLSPDYSSCFGVILLLLLQVLILYAQEFLGPRFFIPLKWQTDCYNYYYKLPPQCEIGQTDIESQSSQLDLCAICITELSIHQVFDHVQTNFLKRLLMRSKQAQNCVMKTPCEHKYHIPCLLKWMELKMECPTCRAPLPPVA